MDKFEPETDTLEGYGVEYLAFLKLDVPRRRMLASSLTHSHQKANTREPTAVDISAASAEISAAKGSVRSQRFANNVDSYWNSSCNTDSRAIPTQYSRFAADYPLLLVHWRRGFHTNERLQRRTIRLYLVRTHCATRRLPISL